MTFPIDLVEEIDMNRGFVPRSRIVEEYVRIGMKVKNGKSFSKSL